MKVFSSSAPSSPQGKGTWKVVAVVIAAVLLALSIPVGAVILHVGLPAIQRADHNDDSKKETAISKSFVVEPGGTLTIDADRGSIDLVTSDVNTVEIAVRRTVIGGSEAESAELLNNHQVTMNQDGDNIRINAKSAVSGGGGWSWFKWKPNLDVHYTIKTPRKFNAALKTLEAAFLFQICKGVSKPTPPEAV